MTDKSLVFLGTSPFAIPSLNCLVDGDMPVTAVITRPDRPSGRGKKLRPTAVKEGALARNLPVYQPHNKRELLETLQKLRPTLLVNVAYGMILPDAVLELPELGCLNLHPSLLPAYRGAAPIQRTLMAGEKETGVTVLFMTSRLDAGDIVLQEQLPVEPEEDFGSLHNRLAEKGGQLLLQAVRLHFEGKAQRIPQNDELATFAPPLTRETERIDWSEGSEKIMNLVRALSPAPGAYTTFRGLRLKILKASCPGGGEQERFNTREKDRAYPPGTISEVDPDYLGVQCGSGVLHILELQPESKRRMDTRSFIQGQPVEVGEKFD